MKNDQPGLKPSLICGTYAALKGRSSMLEQTRSSFSAAGEAVPFQKRT